MIRTDGRPTIANIRAVDPERKRNSKRRQIEARRARVREILRRK